MDLSWLPAGGLSADVGLGGLFLASFLSATLLPGSSEVVFVALMTQFPGHWQASIAIATLGNTLGGMSTYLLARLLPQRADTTRLAWVRRYGAPALFLSWLPLLGDALCAAAGWLRLNWAACLLWMAIGKGLRYAVLAIPFI